MRHANDLTFKLITPEDAAELLVFETQEREWFEQYIEARPQSFYTPQGTTQHIIECLALNAQRRMSPLLIRKRGTIVGRANLRDMQNGQGKVGYRIGEQACGHGIAQRALHFLINEARSVYRLDTLSAIVSVDNGASRRVLEKVGFEAGEKLPDYSLVAGLRLDSVLYKKDIS
ncbi:GNAT family N-acetyltransferase [Halomonas sp. GFAJ-1]|uniref:GNAT family N-acetyltransferase n=1 Tax=Halomonas sp. GFAJ-1 TaxID=1118153 RepID=UPI00023A5958|nr:GNAT family N-acetyltransferase [Halomonas sp. GFAJ-1]AVI62548.1 alanine acetyltransferase [Halomonas sp. GFAJ-1]EHK62354.1 acetyltransferase [Halomonas sp. GFAJ-1]